MLFDGSIDVVPYVMRGLVFCVAIPVHECAHGLVSSWQGDPTAKESGRLTLNPVAHFSWQGFVCMLLCGVGFAKPVPVNPQYYKKPKLGMAVTAAAGPLSNLLLAYVSYLLWSVWYLCAPVNTVNEYIALFFRYMVLYNTALAVFNMLPLPPWDGSRIFLVFLPQKYYFKIMQYERQIFLAVFVLLFLGVFDFPLSWAENKMLTLLGRATQWLPRLIFALNGVEV